MTPTNDTMEWEKRLYALYKEGRGNGTPAGYIDYFLVRNLMYKELSSLKAKAIACVPEEKTNEEFGFCKHCKYHMGDIAHDEACGNWNSCRTATLENLTNL